MVRQEFAKVRRGRDACGMFRQSRWGQDGYGRMGIEKVRQGEAVRDTARCGEEWKHLVWQEVCRGLDGCIWYGKMGFGSLGQVRFRLVRLGWAGLHWNGSVWIGKLGIEMATQEVCNGEMRYETDGTGEVWQSRRGRLR